MKCFICQEFIGESPSSLDAEAWDALFANHTCKGRPVFDGNNPDYLIINSRYEEQFKRWQKEKEA